MADGRPAGAKKLLQGQPPSTAGSRWLLRISLGAERGCTGRSRACSARSGQPRLANGFRWSKKRSAEGYWRPPASSAANGAPGSSPQMDEQKLDAIICPPHTVPAMRHGATYFLYDTPSYLMRFNVLGMPAGSVAATRVRADEETDRPQTRDRVDRAARETEVGSAGLPVGVQVAARHWREDIVLAVMAALEEEFSKRPDYPSRPPA